MSTDMAGQGKPERHPVYKFFTNGFVQGVAVFIALAVAFSGKLDSKGTLVAVLVAGAIGAIGIYTHWSNTVRQKVLAGLSILIYGCVLWAFYSYLTSKPSMSAGNATFQQQDTKPDEKKADGTKPEPSPTPSKAGNAKKTKPAAKVRISGGTKQGGNGDCQANAIGGNATVENCNSGPPPLLINESQQNQLTQSVKPFLDEFKEAKINISMHRATTETDLFGRNLDKAFEAAGYQTNTGDVDFIGAALNRGVTIRFGDKRQGIAEAVGNSLISSHVVDKVYRASGLSDDDFLIIVAP